jgi:hypothetical protein
MLNNAESNNSPLRKVSGLLHKSEERVDRKKYFPDKRYGKVKI